MLRAARLKLTSYWFDKRAESALSVFRVLWCLLVLQEVLLTWIPSFELLFLPGAPFRAVSTLHEAAWWNFLAMIEQPSLLWVAVGVLLGSLMCCLTGRYFRFSIILSWFLLIAFHNLAPTMFFSNHRAIRFLGLCLIFAPAPSAIRQMGFWNSPAHGSVMLRLIQLEFVRIWFFAWIFKMLVPPWQAGEGALIALQMQGYTTSLTQYAIEQLIEFASWSSANAEFAIMFVKSLTWTVLACEFFLSWGLIWPKTRTAAIIVGLLFHSMLFVSMTVTGMQELMIVGLMMFVNWSTVLPKLKQRFSSRASFLKGMKSVSSR